MSEQFLGQIQLFPYNFAPQGWALCNGQFLPINQNTALFSLIGTYYGGDGVHNFALPNFEGSVAVSQGQGPGLSPYIIGERGGATAVTLTPADIPAHSHTLPASTAAGRIDLPSASTNLGEAGGGLSKKLNAYGPSASISMAPSGATGSSTSHNNLAPYLALNYCISLVGIFPARN